MSTTISIESAPGNGVYVDITPYLVHNSITVKFNTLDFQLLNPPPGSSQLTAAVKMTDPAWSGSVAASMSSDVTLQGNFQSFATVTATNTMTLPTDTAPFDLSDLPQDLTTFLTLEDASGHIMIESGTDWAPGALETEAAKSMGYSGLTVQVRNNQTAGGPPQTLGRCRVVAPGLRPGNQFSLNSRNQGYPGRYIEEDFSGAYLLEDGSGYYDLEGGSLYQITQVITKWPALAGSPFFDIEFGDAPQTLAAWTLAHAVPVVVPIGPPGNVPAGTSIWGQTNAGSGLQTMGGGIVTLGSSTFTINPDPGHTLSCQVQGAIDCLAYGWDDTVAAPRRAVRALLSGGVFTGAWQELPYGWSGGPTTGYRQTFDLGSASGLALAAGTYTLSIQINTQATNQIQVFAGWAQVAVIQS